MIRSTSATDSAPSSLRSRCGASRTSVLLLTAFSRINASKGSKRPSWLVSTAGGKLPSAESSKRSSSRSSISRRRRVRRRPRCVALRVRCVAWGCPEVDRVRRVSVQPKGSAGGEQPLNQVRARHQNGCRFTPRSRGRNNKVRFPVCPTPVHIRARSCPRLPVSPPGVVRRRDAKRGTTKDAKHAKNQAPYSFAFLDSFAVHHLRQ